MTRYLRVVRQRRWATFPDIDWIAPGETQADALVDLQTRDNRLSVFRADNDQDIQRVIVALAATRDNVANLDYAIFDDDELVAQGIEITQSLGQTPDETANTLHHDIHNLTVRKIELLARTIAVADHTRVHRRDIQAMLSDALQSGDLERDRVSPTLSTRIN